MELPQIDPNTLKHEIDQDFNYFLNELMIVFCVWLVRFANFAPNITTQPSILCPTPLLIQTHIQFSNFLFLSITFVDIETVLVKLKLISAFPDFCPRRK
jgi:hypothetical protein